MMRNSIIGLLVAGVIATPAFSYTGVLDNFPDVEHIDVTFGQAEPIKVKVDNSSKFKKGIIYKDVYIVLRNGTPVSSKNVKYNTKKFVQVVILKNGVYKLNTDASMYVNDVLKKKRTDAPIITRMKFKKGDTLRFRNRAVDLDMYMEK